MQGSGHSGIGKIFGGFRQRGKGFGEPADFENADREKWEAIANKIVFTGKIDEYYDYRFGKLEYRTVRFESEVLDTDNYQGVAVVNYTDRETPFTRIIEHKHFEDRGTDHTVITHEYPMEWHEGAEPYYPINDEKNNSLYEQYAQLAKEQDGILFGGRLGMYKYYDMDKCIEAALNLCDEEL